jgi:hypothetical protein
MGPKWWRRLADWGMDPKGRRRLADRSSWAAAVLTVGIGWWVVGWPGAARGHDTRLLYSGMVVVAAFLIAAMVQRSIMGDYAVKVGTGGVELQTLADSTSLTTDAGIDLTDQISEMTTVLEDAGKRIGALETSFLEGVEALDERVGALEMHSREDSH